MNEEYAVLTLGYKSLQNVKDRVSEAYDLQKPNEFILVINYYSEESWRILEYAKNEPKITRYAFCSQNIGFSKAINLAYKMSKSKNLIMLSDDCCMKNSSHQLLANALKPQDIGISCVEIGGKSDDIIPIPKGFVLGLKSKMIKECGDYIYDEIASPLGCEQELTYRAKTKNYNLSLVKNCYYSHSFDISSNPQRIINYLGEEMSPQGEKAFQYETEKNLRQKIEQHKKIIRNQNENQLI